MSRGRTGRGYEQVGIDFAPGKDGVEVALPFNRHHLLIGRVPLPGARAMHLRAAVAEADHQTRVAGGGGGSRVREGGVVHVGVCWGGEA